MSLRILHIMQSVHPASGGPIEGVRQIAIAHCNQGHSLEIACLDSPGAPWLSFPGVPVEPCRRHWTDWLFPFTLCRWIHTHRRRYDAVVVNGIWDSHLLAAYLAIRGSATPFFVYPHGMLDPWFRYRYPLKHLKKWFFWPWAIHLPLHAADAVCFTCEQERLLARKSFWLYSVNEIVVGYGTEGIPHPNHDYATPFLQAHPPIAGRQRFLFLGRVAQEGPRPAPARHRCPQGRGLLGSGHHGAGAGGACQRLLRHRAPAPGRAPGHQLLPPLDRHAPGRSEVGRLPIR